jgi:hypothetical protein
MEGAMSRHWIERFDRSKHLNYMLTTDSGGRTVQEELFDQTPAHAYFVKVSGFTFLFLSRYQLHECHHFFSQKTHPSSRCEGPPLNHWYHAWHERLPQQLFEEARRHKVLKALERAMRDFELGKCEIREPDSGDGVGQMRRR